MSIEVQLVGNALSRSIRDLFSPVTELAGAIGDQVRIYRELAVLNVLKRARAAAKEGGLRLNPPPLKFFVPFLEDCSLEDNDDSSLADMWANLLVSASSEFSSQHNLFLRILREITKREAEAFQYIVTGRVGVAPKYPIGLDDVEPFWKDSYVYIQIRDLIRSEKKPLSKISYSAFEKKLRGCLETEGAVITYLSVARGRKNHYPLSEVHDSGRDYIEDHIDPMSLAMLHSLGLIGRYHSPEFWFGSHVFEIDSLYVTGLGASFYRACAPRQKNG